MPPSEPPNRADEWSFSLCCVAIFSAPWPIALAPWRFAGESSLRDESAAPFCGIDYPQQLHACRLINVESKFDMLQRALLDCAPSGRSFAYMWGASLRAHLKFSAQRGKIRTQRARRNTQQRPVSGQKYSAQSACLDERAHQRHANCSSRR